MSNPYTLTDVDRESWIGGQRERVLATVERIAELEKESALNDTISRAEEAWAQGDYEKLKLERDALRADLATAADVARTLAEERDEARAEADRWMIRSLAAESMGAVDAKERDAAQKELGDVLENLDVNSLNAALNEARKERDDLRVSIAIRDACISSAQQERDEARGLAADCGTAAARQVAAAVRERDEVRKSHEQLLAVGATTARELTAAIKERDQASARLRLRGRCVAAWSERDQARKERDEARAGRESLFRERDSLHLRIGEISEERDSLRAQLAVAQADLTRADLTVAEALAACETAAEALAACETERANKAETERANKAETNALLAQPSDSSALTAYGLGVAEKVAHKARLIYPESEALMDLDLAGLVAEVKP